MSFCIIVWPKYGVDFSYLSTSTSQSDEFHGEYWQPVTAIHDEVDGLILMSGVAFC
jgi:hypothetical protein